jgi:hypothetical protein
MKAMAKRWTVLVASLGLLAAAPAPPQATNPRGEILRQAGPAVVRIEALVSTKFNMGGQAQEQESRLDLNGALVDDKGLVMIWNSYISSSRMNEMMSDMGRGGGDFRVEMRPTEFRVFVGQREEEILAFLAATDTALDLAFLQLERVPEDLPAPIRFEDGVDPQPGDEVVALNRMKKSFDFAPLVESARVGGEIRKPRRAWILDGELTGFGLPVFDLEGRPVGALTTIFSRAGEDNPFESGGLGMMGMMSGQGSWGPFGAFVLPASRVASVVRLARQRADELLAEGVSARQAPAEVEEVEEVEDEGEEGDGGEGA